MQTFLPLPDFAASAAVLDNRRLGKQRVEAYQLFRAIQERGGWSNHPAARMWRGYENALVKYALEMHDAWIARGFKDTTRERMIALFDPAKDVVLPPWFGDAAFHASHRSNLLRKDPSWYGKLGWCEPADLPYVWPV